jgi:hypothetical protein
MNVTIRAVDRYNFNKGAGFMGIPDEYFGELAPVGLAKNYTLHGTITRKVTFTLGTGSAPEVKGPSAPGRTDKQDGRR